jgi:hypothetical protein
LKKACILYTVSRTSLMIFMSVVSIEGDS